VTIKESLNIRHGSTYRDYQTLKGYHYTHCLCRFWTDKWPSGM